MSKRVIGLWVLVLLLALLGVGTINNQLRINRANEVLAAQAASGQRALTRQCKTYPIGRKLYVWAMRHPESGITPDDFAVVESTAAIACHP